MWLRRFLLVGPVVLALLLGLVLAFPLSMLRPHPLAAAVWRGSPGTRWAGAQLRGMDVPGHKGIVREQFLELRCVMRPSLNTRLDYWPGPAWDGKVSWEAAKVVYVPDRGQEARPRRFPANIPASAWLDRCPTS